MKNIQEQEAIYEAMLDLLDYLKASDYEDDIFLHRLEEALLSQEVECDLAREGIELEDKVIN